MDQTKNLNISRHVNVQKGDWSYLQFSVAVLLGVIALGVLVWWVTATGQSQSTPSAPAVPQLGEPALGFSLSSLSGDTIRLSDYKGQVVVVNLWATWCPPCRAEMPMIHAYYQAHKEAGLTVLAVNDAEDAATVKRFIEVQGYQFPVVLDTQSAVSALYDVRGLPTTLIIDREGRLQYVHTGEISAKQLDTMIKPLL